MKTLIAAVFSTALMAAQPTLTVTVTPQIAYPGTTVTATTTFTDTAQATGVAGLQFTEAIQFAGGAVGPTGLSLIQIAGPAANTAGKSITCNTTSGMCLEVGVNTGTFSNGVVAVGTFVVPKQATAGPYSIALSNTLGANLAGSAVPITAGPSASFTVGTFDLNGDGATDVLDLQLLINQILTGTAKDISGDGITNIVDAQVMANALRLP